MKDASDEALLAEYNQARKEVDAGETKKAHLTKIHERTKKWLDLLERTHACVEKDPNPIEPTFNFQKDEEWKQCNKEVVAHKQKSERINVEEEIKQLETAIDAHYKEMSMQSELMQAFEKEFEERGVKYE